MKLAEAFAKRTYGPKSLPTNVSNADVKRVTEQLADVLEEYVILHLFQVWSELHQEPDMTEAHGTFTEFMTNWSKSDVLDDQVYSMLNFTSAGDDVVDVILNRIKERIRN